MRNARHPSRMQTAHDAAEEVPIHLVTLGVSGEGTGYLHQRMPWTVDARLRTLREGDAELCARVAQALVDFGSAAEDVGRKAAVLREVGQVFGRAPIGEARQRRSAEARHGGVAAQALGFGGLALPLLLEEVNHKGQRLRGLRLEEPREHVVQDRLHPMGVEVLLGLPSYLLPLRLLHLLLRLCAHHCGRKVRGDRRPIDLQTGNLQAGALHGASERRNACETNLL
mmetsp:Transcript_65526/g.188872  ORF Transcript_65526/g.188872 Transcript_65526/m.188872 type:complete len:226 (+) Transcript_65526:1487-2164(+)